MKEHEVIGRIQALCDARGWTLYRLAKESGITYSTLCTMLHKGTSPSISTLIKLCDGFGITLSEFFDTGSERANLTAAQKANLARWSQLSPANRQAIEKYIKFLLSEQQK